MKKKKSLVHTLTAPPSCEVNKYTNSQIRHLISLLQASQCDVSHTKLGQMQYGYNLCVSTEDLFDQAGHYINVLQDHLARKECLNSCELQELIESAMTFTGVSTCDKDWKDLTLIIDECKLTEWVAINPEAVAKEKYELLARDYLKNKLFMDSLCSDDVRKIFYDFSIKKLSDEIVAMISVYQNHKCDIDPSVKISLHDYKLELDIINSNSSCDLKIEEFKNLREDCKMPLELINKLYKSGLNVKPNGSCPILNVGSNEYNLCDTLFDIKNKLSNE